MAKTGRPLKDKRVHVGIGPLVPLVPVGDFTRLDGALCEDAWQLVGPSVERNLNTMRPTPLWTIFAACYLEGLNHGAGAMRERLRERERSAASPSLSRPDADEPAILVVKGEYDGCHY